MASYDRYAAIEIGATGRDSDAAAAGAWIEAKDGRIEANLHEGQDGNGWSFCAGDVGSRCSSEE